MIVQEKSESDSQRSNPHDDIYWASQNDAQKKEPEATDNEKRIRRFGFVVDRFHFLVPEGLFCELLIDPPVTPLPNAANHVRGLVNVRGNIITLYSLSFFLKQKDEESSQYAYLLDTPQKGAALLINNKPGLVDITEAQQQRPDDIDVDYKVKFFIDGVFSIDNRQWLSLSHQDLFTRLSMSL